MGTESKPELVQIAAATQPRPELEAARARLAASRGPQVWRSLEDLAAIEGFGEMLEREFPHQSAGVLDEVSRRNFLKLMSASLALAGLSGCTKLPVEQIVPYVRQPEEMVLGKALFFATAFTLGGYGEPVLARSHEGRPNKIEGNPEHPASRGGTSLYAQASVLDLYAPDRSQNVAFQGEVRPWAAFVGAMQGPVATQNALKGAGLRLLTQNISSPTLTSQIRALQQSLPQMKWHRWEPLHRDGARNGAHMAFGEVVETRYQLESADIIVTLDADFLYPGFPGFAVHAREWARRRDPDHAQGMSRMYAIESSPTTTGFKADHRLPVRASEIEQYARALASALGVAAGGTVRPEHAAWVQAVADDLKKHRGRCVVIPGEAQPAAVHALAHAINEVLDAPGHTVVYTDSVVADPQDNTASFQDLVTDIRAGKVDLLLMLGGNPVFDCPADIDLAGILSKVPLKVHYGLYANETAAASDWHVNATHYLEEWSDVRAFNGTAGIVQPLIAPLYEGHSAHEILAVFSGQPDAKGYDLVRAYWKAQYKGADFEEFWRRSVHDGLVAGSEYAPRNLKVKVKDFASIPSPPKIDGLEIIFRQDANVYDGRFADNGWLQECPKPLTKVTWENPVYVSPATATRLGLHGTQDTDLVEIEHGGHKITVPVWIQAGQPDDCVTLFLGSGRRRSGRTGTGRGVNTYALRFAGEPYHAGGVNLSVTGQRYKLASTQGYQEIQGRNLVRMATLDTYKQHPDFAHLNNEAPAKSDTLYTNYPYPEYAWGMSINLNSCVGCNACIVACVAENNIAVVGKEQVLMGRHMHWLRVDGYYEGDAANPRMYFEPLPCMQCENAPCELVCPVNATVHSTEGLNDMVYNRCVGTRYCSNNCPWKVRRFNFLLFQDWTTPQTKMVRNPEVTVRSRGVMEKCTYCTQRIVQARIASEKEDRRVQDGEILTACQQACPAGAIVFGDINDPKAKVRELKENPRNFGILEELNTRPRTTHLAAVLNPNPEMPAAISQQQPEQHY